MANCNWTSPEIVDPLDLALFCLDFSVYHRGCPVLAVPLESQSVEPYFLYYLLIGKDILKSHVKLSKIVLSNAISVPAHCFEYQALIPDNWQVETHIPFRI